MLRAYQQFYPDSSDAILDQPKGIFTSIWVSTSNSLSCRHWDWAKKGGRVKPSCMNRKMNLYTCINLYFSNFYLLQSPSLKSQSQSQDWHTFFENLRLSCRKRLSWGENVLILAFTWDRKIMNGWIRMLWEKKLFMLRNYILVGNLTILSAKA